MSNDSDLERRKHGCDGCQLNVSTERFDGYLDHNLWLCGECFMELITNGIKSRKLKDVIRRSSE
ncbi:hypothetical protein LCGC14_1588810 [marine sediment metagenome]|uniref:Uncharacterized protein n=1 Tax=marine sediment metagenome TaxID=412755 RepID=A0A0F9LF26_9ZZZZ